MVFKTKMILLCPLICGLGIIESRCVAMQRPYRSAAQEAERRKHYWLDQFNVRKDDKQWLQKFRNTIIEYKFATAAELDALIDGNSASSTADTPAETTQPVQPVEQNAAADTFNLAELHRQAQLQRKNQKDSARAPEASSTAQNASNSSGENSDSASQMQSQMQEINAARAARYAKNLLDSFNQAKERGDLAWLKEHRDVLIKMNQSLQEEIDELIQALELSQELAPQPANAQNDQELQEAADQQQREQEQSYRKIQIAEMKRAQTEQEAAAALVRLYKLLADTRGERYQQHYAMVDQLPLQPTLTDLNAELAGLAEVPEIKELIENEIKILQGHMLYRLWTHPSEITPDMAFEAFCDAAQRNDYNAMINLYKTYLVKSDYNEPVIEATMGKLHEAITHNDATAIFDLYHHFLTESSGAEQALTILYNYIESGKAPAEIWGIIALCFVGTEHGNVILPMIAAQLRRDAAIFTQELVNRYDEYRTAIINGEVEKVIDLGNHLVESGILDRATFNMAVTSMAEHQQPQQALDDTGAHNAMIDDQDLSPEDAAAIQRILDGND